MAAAQGDRNNINRPGCRENIKKRKRRKTKNEK